MHFIRIKNFQQNIIKNIIKTIENINTVCEGKNNISLLKIKKIYKNNK